MLNCYFNITWKLLKKWHTKDECINFEENGLDPVQGQCISGQRKPNWHAIYVLILIIPLEVGLN